MMVNSDHTNEVDPADSAPDERGITLIEIMIALTISSIILIPVTAWGLLALNRSQDNRQQDATAGATVLNRFLKADVAGSEYGQNSNSTPSLLNSATCAANPAVGFGNLVDGQVRLKLLSEGRTRLTTYIEVPTGKTDVDTGKPFMKLVRRQCSWDDAASTAPGSRAGTVDNEDVVAESLLENLTANSAGPPVYVSCEQRDNYTEPQDGCGEVAMTLRSGTSPTTVKAVRRIDPVIEESPDRKTSAVILCTPRCPASGDRRYAVEFNSDSSFDPYGIEGVEWDFGDGTISNSLNVRHVFNPAYLLLGPQTFTVKLTVFSKDGTHSSTAQTQVTVKNARPVPVATPVQVSGNRVDWIPFDASGSVDPDSWMEPGLELEYLWNFGDGNTSTEKKPAGGYRYTTIGDRTVTLTVKDPECKAAGPACPGETVEIPVSIKNVAPIACFETVQTSPVAPSPNAGACSVNPIVIPPKAIYTDSVSTTITFNSLSRDYEPNPLGKVNAQFWFRGSGTTKTQVGTGPTLTQTFSRGVYTIQLEVIDNEGARSTYPISIEVNSRPVAVINPSNGCTWNSGPYKCILAGSGSYDEDGTITNYSWDFGDGSAIRTGPPAVFDPPDLPYWTEPEYTWPEKGVYTATLTVTDNSGSKNSVSVRVKANSAPKPVIGDGAASKISALRGKDLPLTSVNTTDDDTGASYPTFGIQDPKRGTDSIQSYSWNFGDPASGALNTSNEANPSHKFVALGDRTVTLTVTDEDGASSSTTRIVNVRNQFPVAVIAGTSLTDGRTAGYGWVSQGLSPGLSAGASYDPDGVPTTAITYLWSLGDGTTSTLAQPNKTYDPQFYGQTITVTLVVKDVDQDTDTLTLSVKVNRPPVAEFTSSLPFNTVVQSPSPATQLLLDGSSSTDSGGSITKYDWKFTSTNPAFRVDPSGGPSPTEQISYNQRGTFFIQLTVTDDLGGTGTITRQVLRINASPVAKITATPATDKTVNPSVTYDAVAGSGQQFSFSSLGSEDPDGSILTYSWNFGDGTTSNLANPTKTYTAFQNYTVTLTLRDNENLDGLPVQVIVKVNRPPTAKIGNTLTTPLNAGRNVPLSISASPNSSDGEGGRIVSYAWQFGDGTSATTTGPTTSKTYNPPTIPRTYTITLTVTDNDGATTVTSRDVLVSNTPPVASFTMNNQTVTKLVSNAGPNFSVSLDASASTDPDFSTLPKIKRYDWTFGDGTTASTTNPVYVKVFGSQPAPDDYGTWSVSLVVIDQLDADSPPVAKSVKVNRAPVVSFIPNQTPAQPEQYKADPPFVVNFDATATTDTDNGSVLPGTAYKWSFGDNTIGFGPTISKTYTAAGTYTVTLAVTDSDSNVTTVQKIGLVRVNRKPTATITAPNTSSRRLLVELPAGTWTTSAFGATATDPDGSIVDWSWDWGDGTAAGAGQFPGTHPYTQWGTYTVTLTVTDNNGGKGTSTISIRVVAAPTAGIGPVTLDPKKNLPFTFDDSLSSDVDGTIVAWEWTFGTQGVNAGTPRTSTLKNPAITWPANYTNVPVTLRVQDSDGRFSPVVTRFVNIVDNVAPVASFATTPDPAKGKTNPFTVGVNASTSTDPEVGGSIVSYSWNWGDGTPNGSGMITTHDYTTFGNFTITLTVKDNSGATNTTTKAVRNNRPPVIAVVTSPNPPIFNATPWNVQFNASGTTDDGMIMEYRWNFGDGSPEEVGVTASHSYTARNIYTAVLTVTDNEGASSTYPITVKVNKPPTALFDYSPPSAPRLLPVTFDGRGSSDEDGTVVSWAWDFGDGTFDSGAVVEHLFTAIASYQVKLTVTDENFATHTRTISVQTSNPPPVARILITPAAPTVVELGETIHLDGGTSFDPDGTLVSYAWDFGDGHTDNKIVPTDYAFTTIRTHIVTLTVTDNSGDTSQASVTVRVNSPPSANIVGTPAPFRDIPFAFQGTGSDTDGLGTIKAYRWDFADGPGSTSTQQNPTYTYKSFGTKTISFTVTDSDDRAVTVTKQINVSNQKPVARIVGTARNVPNPATLSGAPALTVDFSASTSTDPDNAVDANPSQVIKSYRWFFNGIVDNSQTGATAVKTFSTVGSYTAAVIVTDSDNQASDLASVPVTVTTNVAPTPRFVMTPPSGPGPLTVNFNPASSSDDDGVITSYFWNFGFGVTSTVANDTRTFTPGQYPVTLTITDNSGGSAQTTQTLSVSGTMQAPNGLRQSGNSGNDPQFTWDPVTGATGYEIKMRANGILCGDKSASVGAGVTSVTVGNGCIVSATYDIQVRAMNGAEAGFWSDVVRINI